ncbi:MAG: hypothetical protein L3K18_04210 [Thermoplasmata archaeon]|nr:hypothetical protein [Thermoplasmata archaeon]MCI4356332.1 hypothetical protein [Thermoplasmata archaeon]
MLLEAGETEVRHEHVVPYRFGETTGRGSVYLTNRRLVIESTPSRLLPSGAPATVADLPLRTLTNATVGSVLRRPRYLAVEAGNDRFRLDVVHPADWVRALKDAKATAPSAHSSAPAATHTIERHIVKIRCRHCGTLSDERHGRCASCGAAL